MASAFSDMKTVLVSRASEAAPARRVGGLHRALGFVGAVCALCGIVAWSCSGQTAEAPHASALALYAPQVMSRAPSEPMAVPPSAQLPTVAQPSQPFTPASVVPASFPSLRQPSVAVPLSTTPFIVEGAEAENLHSNVLLGGISGMTVGGALAYFLAKKKSTAVPEEGSLQAPSSVAATVLENAALKDEVKRLQATLGELQNENKHNIDAMEKARSEQRKADWLEAVRADLEKRVMEEEKLGDLQAHVDGLRRELRGVNSVDVSAVPNSIVPAVLNVPASHRPYVTKLAKKLSARAGAVRMQAETEPQAPQAPPAPEDPPAPPPLPKIKTMMVGDGTLAGDMNFDPLQLAKDSAALAFYREAEIKHARLAMLAAFGWPVSELTNFGKLLNGDGRAPSLLNGGLENINGAYWGLVLAIAVYWEGQGLDKQFGKQDNYLPGMLGFDPLGMDSDFFRNAEITNGRVAMVAITAYAIEEAVTKAPIFPINLFQ